MADASRDQNFVTSLLGVSSSDGVTPVKVYADPITHRLLVDISGGSGTVTSVSVVTANGFAGTVADPTTTPAITLSTTVTGIVKGNGTALSAASAGTDYVAPGAITSSGLTMATARLLGRTTASTGAVEEISVGTGLTLSAGSLSASVADISPLTTKGDLWGYSTLNARIPVGSDGQVLTADSAQALGVKWASGPAASLTVGTTTISSGTTTRILYDNAGTLGEYTITGTGTVVAMQTNPTLSGLTMTDATNMVLDTTTGTKIGTATSQKLAFYNSTPIVQPTGDVATALQNLGLVSSATVTATNISTATENSDTTCFPVFVTASGTQTLPAKTNTTLVYNSSTSSLGATLLTATTSVTSASILASSNDSGALGASGTAFSDLFLASGGVINWNAGNYTLTHSSGLLTANGAFSIGTSNALTCGTIELGAASDTTLSRSAAGVLAVEGVVIPSVSSTNTLTNKRITRRLTTTNAPGATPTTNTDNVDIMNFTGLGTAITSMTTNLSGTPVDGQLLEFRFTDDGTARAITWGASFGATTVALPTTTVISTMLRVLFEYNGSIWQCIATA